MKNLDKYAVAICHMIVACGTCYFGGGCSACELCGFCCDEDELLAFRMQPADEDDQQLLQEPQGTV